jgi:hypothetical protein
MLWSWFRADGTRFVPATVPAIWRRISERRPWTEAEARFGPLDGEIPPVRWRENWETFHARLVTVAELWRALPGDLETLYRPPEPATLRQHPAAQEIRHATGAMIEQGFLTTTFDLPTWKTVARATSLRALVLARCAESIGEAPNFRRCRHCHEWYPVYRRDNLFCSTSCKQSAYTARRGGDC